MEMQWKAHSTDHEDNNNYLKKYNVIFIITTLTSSLSDELSRAEDVLFTTYWYSDVDGLHESSRSFLRERGEKFFSLLP